MHGNDALRQLTEPFESSDRQVKGFVSLTSGALILDGRIDNGSIVGSDFHLLSTMGSIGIHLGFLDKEWVLDEDD
jgi:hypothetical protein